MNSSTNIDIHDGGKLQLHITASAETAQGAINAAYEELQRAAKALNCTLVTFTHPSSFYMPENYLRVTTPHPTAFTIGPEVFSMTTQYPTHIGMQTGWGDYTAPLTPAKTPNSETEVVTPLKAYVASHWLSNSVSCTDGVYAIIATDIDTLRFVDTESGKLLYCAASATLFDRIQEVAKYIENSPDLKDEAEPCSNPFDAEWYSLMEWSNS